MGKRKKSSRGPVKRVVQKLDTKFNCLFCNHDKSVSCTIDKKNSIGSLSCKICGQTFQTRINALSQPVDVYSDWFDAVEEVNAGRGSESERDDDESGSSSDYESDSDAEPRASRAIDSEEEELESDEERIGSVKRGRGTLVDSDDE
ncbi:hypothetical protein Kpol_1051p19 [Vanderwaltozyma polyspora DSM 70294]|uniref:Transcription elongation factor 1 homolog n=1 Tax=Vanderwaltozyma polyspora (strain ATCC 22028 / DSM 70294 / BCRC 21397 / CBS 2163 / NBRC 10782 / NRRL Y-8283 / UCD 57-17) TaxID=436907 RepID=A7TMY2_VANPO|nr:uncharacterized protein Kpol_1051p19 [Vanderwaltozyma polyspora DSM 70294]EDO16370.1 hypothetical protein Kpol_1051p19 [Vanderwaltozyma polyspora DSM 70294]